MEESWNSCSRSRWSASRRRRRWPLPASWGGARRTTPTGPRSRRCAGRWTRSSSPARSSSARASATRRRCCSSARRSAGTTRTTSPQIDIAVDPLEGTNLVAHGQGNAITVLAASEKGGLTHAPDTYLEKLCVGPVVAGKVDIRESPTENIRRIAEALGRRVNDITIVILDRPRHESLIDEVREAGARIKLITDGDLSAAISCAVSGTGVHAVMGIGGAPEGVLTAAALRCLGGEIQARFRYRNPEEKARGAAMGHGDEDRVYTTEDLASGEQLVFAATGVTDGDLLNGVRYFGGGARTHSLSMAYTTKQVRFIDTVHMFDRDRPPSVRL